MPARALSRRPLLATVLTAAAVVLTIAAPPADAASPGRNGRIVFERDGQIVTSSPRGTNLKVLVGSGYNLNPQWSPDGRWIVWTDSGAYPQQLRVMRADGTKRRTVLTAPSKSCGLSKPFFTPDGKLGVDVLACRITRARLHFVNLDGSGLTKYLPGLRGDVSGAAISPNGRWVAFTHQVGTRKAAMFIARRDGSRLRRVSPRGFWPGAPDWSPDGKSIAYTVDGDVRIVRLSDGRQRRVQANGFLAAWSPDGRKISFVRVEGLNDNYNIWTMNVDGSGARRIIGTTKYETTPHWQPLP